MNPQNLTPGHQVGHRLDGDAVASGKSENFKFADKESNEIERRNLTVQSNLKQFRDSITNVVAGHNGGKELIVDVDRIFKSASSDLSSNDSEEIPNAMEGVVKSLLDSGKQILVQTGMHFFQQVDTGSMLSSIEKVSHSMIFSPAVRADAQDELNRVMMRYLGPQTYTTVGG